LSDKETLKNWRKRAVQLSIYHFDVHFHYLTFSLLWKTKAIFVLKFKNIANIVAPLLPMSLKKWMNKKSCDFFDKLN